MMLEWLPIPQNFAADLRAALAIDDGSKRLAALATLSEHRLTFLETLQLDRTLQTQKFDATSGYTRVRLAVLGTNTMDHLIPSIRVAGVRRRLRIETYVGAYGQYRQELLDARAELRKFAPHVVLIALTAREAMTGVPVTATGAEAADAIQKYVAEHRQLWRRAKDDYGAAVVQQTFLDITDPVFGSFDRAVPGSPARIVQLLNEQLFEAATDDGVLVLDIARAAERDGQRAWFDRARWFQAKQEISPSVAPLYGDLVARLIAAQRGLSKKCLVLDLDNTLWSGVVGDDGIDGIVLGEGSAVGEAHAALQRYARALKERGIVLAVCSKNDLRTAEALFDEHPEMILRRSDISAFIANWNDKAENLRMIADQLNIGLESLVFVDDNPAERARVRQALPMVSVPELPNDVVSYVPCLAEAGYFESVGFTPEDAQRSGQYAANIERDSLRSVSVSLDDFLRDLKMSVEFGPFATADLARVTQLINKTNQFNPTMRRYTADEVARLTSEPENLTMQFRLLDRFGDNGLVSAAVLVPDPDSAHGMTIASWVMSCRVFGRQLELEAMNILMEAAMERGVHTLRAAYVPAARNGAIAGLFATLGFARASAIEDTSGASEWIIEPHRYVAKPTYIKSRPSALALPAAPPARIESLGLKQHAIEHAANT